MSRGAVGAIPNASAAPSKKKHPTFDGFDNFLSRLGLKNENTLSAGQYIFNLITRNRLLLEAAYRGSWIVGAVIDSVAEDMTRAGIDIQTSQECYLESLKKKISRLRIWESLQLLIKWGRRYWGASNRRSRPVYASGPGHG